MKHRMYVDEVGNHDIGSSNDPRHRHLSLTGVIMELNYVRTVVFPAIENLKGKYFESHPDDPVILHRKELVNARGPFAPLRDPDLKSDFDADLLQLLSDLDYVVVTVVIDKREHGRQYRAWRYDP